MPTRRLVGVSVLLITCLALVACDFVRSPTRGGEEPADAAPAGAADPTERRPAGRLTTNVPRGSDAQPVSTVVTIRATHARLVSVTLVSAADRVDGATRAGRTKWVASDRLEPGQAYTLQGIAEGADGALVRLTSRFRTEDLTLDQQTYASVAPLAGETVGVGMPVIVSFDLPVTDRAEVERHMTVTSTPRQRGSWHWFSDHRARWRPAKHWRPGTHVSVDLDINGVAAGGGIYGQEDRSVDFEVGDAHVYRVDARTHQMKVFSNGELLRTLPVTLGKAGFTTRSGTKVIMAKHASKRMNSETIGIPAGTSEAYDLDNVQWAMRLTHTGEFIHAAPWSTASQGRANVSHGCTGLSTQDAAWLYDMSRRGDVVVYTGTDRPMTLENGYGDWNADFQSYRTGSALG